MKTLDVGVEMETCFACLTKPEAILMICLPVLVVTVWFLIDTWMRK